MADPILERRLMQAVRSIQQAEDERIFRALDALDRPMRAPLTLRDQSLETIDDEWDTVDLKRVFGKGLIDVQANLLKLEVCNLSTCRVLGLRGALIQNSFLGTINLESGDQDPSAWTIQNTVVLQRASFRLAAKTQLTIQGLNAPCLIQRGEALRVRLEKCRVENIALTGEYLWVQAPAGPLVTLDLYRPDKDVAFSAKVWGDLRTSIQTLRVGCPTAGAQQTPGSLTLRSCDVGALILFPSSPQDEVILLGPSSIGHLQIDGSRAPASAVTVVLESLDLSLKCLDLNGRLRITKQGVPERCQSLELTGPAFLHRGAVLEASEVLVRAGQSFEAVDSAFESTRFVLEPGARADFGESTFVNCTLWKHPSAILQGGCEGLVLDLTPWPSESFKEVCLTSAKLRRVTLPNGLLLLEDEQ